MAPGGFRVLSRIAMSAHSRVYLAQGPESPRVALKELVFRLAPDTQRIEAFRRETQFALHSDAGGAMPFYMTMSSDGKQITWRTNVVPFIYQLERSSIVMSDPIPPSLYAPKSEAEALTAIQGVWLFTQRDATIAGAKCDGLRFDSSGRFEYLDVEADGKLAPALAARTGRVSFSSFSLSSTIVQVNLHFDSGNNFIAFGGWNTAGGTQMVWTLYMGPVVTLNRSSESVPGTVPPPPVVHGTTEAALAATQGVWLFPERDMLLVGKRGDAIRFNATGRWELLDVLDDGSVSPAQQAAWGIISFSPPPGPTTVQLNLLGDLGAGLGMQTKWSQDGQRMSWLGDSWNGLLKRSNATVAMATASTTSVQLNLHPSPNSGYAARTNWTWDFERMNWLTQDGARVLLRSQAQSSSP